MKASILLALTLALNACCAGDNDAPPPPHDCTTQGQVPWYDLPRCCEVAHDDDGTPLEACLDEPDAPICQELAEGGS